MGGGALPSRAATPVCTIPMSRREPLSTSASAESVSITAEVRMSRSAGAPPRSLAAIAPTALNSPATAHPVSAWNRGASAATSPFAAPPLSSRRTRSPSGIAHRRNHPVAGDRQVAHPHAEGVEYGVADGGRGRAVRGLAGPDRPLVRPRQDLDLDRRHLREAQDRVALPAVAGDAGAVEADRLADGPAGGLDGAAFDLVGHPVRVDDLAHVHGDHQPPHPDLRIGGDLGDDGAIGADALVA